MSNVTVGAFAALGPQAPSFRVRTKIPAAELARHGVQMRHLQLLDEQQDRTFHSGSPARRLQVALQARRRLRRELNAAGALDVALVQRQVDLLPSLRLERLATAAGDRLVLDVDDAIWLDGSPEAGGHRLAALKGTRRKVRWLAERAETVIAGNDLLADWLARYGERVVVVPSLVEHREIAPRVHEQREQVVLGWIGSPSTARSLEGLRAPLAALAREGDGQRFELLIVGGPAPLVEGVRVRSEAWSEERERQFLREVDIGLMPLPDNAWTRGKCAYKALQYMAAGIPVVADRVGVSADVIGHERGGLIADSPGDWRQYVATLAVDPGLRSRLGREGRARVVEGFSVQTWAPTLAEIFRGGR
jgi:glycosyltransferase involved in cell wall biosynthesis